MREIAEREHLSQNEFIEQAVEREVVARGALLAEELAAAASRLAQLTEEQYAVILRRSTAAFIAGEGGPDPLQAAALHTDGHGAGPMIPAPASQDALGVLAAFESARR